MNQIDIRNEQALGHSEKAANLRQDAETLTRLASADENGLGSVYGLLRTQAEIELVREALFKQAAYKSFEASGHERIAASLFAAVPSLSEAV
jgi:hypothetical protein